MKTVQFLQDMGSARIGNISNYTDEKADLLIEKGVAKLFNPSSPVQPPPIEEPVEVETTRERTGLMSSRVPNTTETEGE